MSTIFDDGQLHPPKELSKELRTSRQQVIATGVWVALMFVLVLWLMAGLPIEAVYVLAPVCAVLGLWLLRRSPI